MRNKRHRDRPPSHDSVSTLSRDFPVLDQRRSHSPRGIYPTPKEDNDLLLIPQVHEIDLEELSTDLRSMDKWELGNGIFD